ncbi:hypothetical protein PA0529 [Candidatus Phytoplasma australiense]|uniref:Uncharacterized protein n=1 Tax=Phytoplasma australiense TaxID=59748 RepID=B1VA90_PHYAS|nr:hypothetical protein PA0529 [Candidatus Phytoplasma australiense]
MHYFIYKTVISHKNNYNKLGTKKDRLKNKSVLKNFFKIVLNDVISQFIKIIIVKKFVLTLKSNKNIFAFTK